MSVLGKSHRNSEGEGGVVSLVFYRSDEGRRGGGVELAALLPLLINVVP